MKKFIISIDQGTTSSRAILFDLKGKPVYSSHSDGHWLRSLVVTLAVAIIGLRMGLGAVSMWRRGFLNKEFPRYQYQRIRWQDDGKDNIALAAQVEGITQGLANASFLALPIFIISSNNAAELFPLELVGLFI